MPVPSPGANPALVVAVQSLRNTSSSTGVGDSTVSWRHRADRCGGRGRGHGLAGGDGVPGPRREQAGEELALQRAPVTVAGGGCCGRGGTVGRGDLRPAVEPDVVDREREVVVLEEDQGAVDVVGVDVGDDGQLEVSRASSPARWGSRWPRLARWSRRRRRGSRPRPQDAAWVTPAQSSRARRAPPRRRWKRCARLACRSLRTRPRLASLWPRSSRRCPVDSAGAARPRAHCARGAAPVLGGDHGLSGPAAVGCPRPSSTEDRPSCKRWAGGTSSTRSSMCSITEPRSRALDRSRKPAW